MQKKEDTDDDQKLEWLEDDVLFYGVIPAVIIIPLAIIGVFVLLKRSSGSGGGPCPACGDWTEYLDEYDSYYCWNCEEYL